MVQEEATLVRLLSQIKNDLLGNEQIHLSFDAVAVERALILHLKHRDSTPTIIELILPILQILWRKRKFRTRESENNENVGDSITISSCLPTLLRLWWNHVPVVTETLTMLARERLVPTKDLLDFTRMHIPRIITEISAKDDVDSRTAIIFLIHELTNARDNNAMCLYEETWEFVLQTSTLFPHMATRIVWNWALQIPHDLGANQQIWSFLRDYWDANAAAALGLLVLSTSNARGSADQDAKANYNYPDWLPRFLLQSFRTTISTRRRVMRTLKCLVLDQPNNNISVEDLASVLVLGVMYKDDVPTQVLACQTVHNLVERESSICSPSLEHAVVQCIESAQTDKLLLLALPLLTIIIDKSKWSRSAQCFANEQFFQQIQDFLQRDRQSHATVVVKLLHSLQQNTTSTSMDKLMCDHYLSILAIMLSVKSTRRLVMPILNRMVLNYAKEMAADENLLNALVILCMEEEPPNRKQGRHGNFKDSVKGLILQLIPEL